MMNAQQQYVHNEPSANAYSFLRITAKVISYIFHPVFIPVMVIWFLLYEHPYQFAGFAPQLKIRILVMSVVSFTLFPMVTVLLLRALRFIDTLYLNTQKDRVIPFIACMIWYFWIWNVWNNFGKTQDSIDMPAAAVQFALATFLSTFIGLMMNIRMKISLHTIAAGIVLAFFIRLALTQDLQFGIWLSIVFILTGIICTARLIISDHTVTEIYSGLAAGIGSFLLALQIDQWING